MFEFKDRLKEALKDGIIIAVRYSIFLILLAWVLLLYNGTRDMAINGNTAALAIKAFQEKGYLPLFNPDGKIPDKK